MKNERLSWLAGLVVAATLSACASSSAGITAKVKTKLAADPVVKAHQIEVDTNNGVVTLTGNIESQEAKDRALMIAKETKGVVEVRDMIEVRTSETTGNAPDTDRSIGQTIDDAGITMKVKAKLLDEPTVKGLKIDVDTREGVVYLTGQVATPQVRDEAIRIARETEGVRDVQANLEIIAG